MTEQSSMCFLIILAIFAEGIYGADWSYRGPTGPEYWPDLFPLYCAGSEQSPINLNPLSATPSDFKTVELYGYSKNDIPSPSKMVFMNDGHTVLVDITGDFHIKGGPFNATYQTFQLHFHWGSTDAQGSEHTVAGHRYAAELHIVHWDRDNYESLDEAMMHRYGLAVFGIFIEVGNQPNPAFEKLVQAIDKVKFKGNSYTLPEVLTLADLVPSAGDLSEYFHYDGGFTTPTCNEGVAGLIFRKPIVVTSQQLAAFRTVHENELADGVKNVTLVDNIRPVQPLNARTVYIASSTSPYGDCCKAAYGHVPSIVTLMITVILSLIVFM